MNEKCQVFTPVDYVTELLDSLGYTNNLYGKKILENSCGDGNILTVIVQRYIDDCRNRGLSRTKIKNGLSKDVVGYEIDKKTFLICIDNLNKVLEVNGIRPVNWSIYNADYLTTGGQGEFDYIVGNPPYLTYTDMEEKDRAFLKKEFKSCSKGKYDYCYAFIEKSITDLKSDGKMAYLIPSSIFKTVSGERLRVIMKPYISKVMDYTQDQVFQFALVKSAIMMLEKNCDSEFILYQDTVLGKNIRVPKEHLGKKWFFKSTFDMPQHRFGDYFKISHVVATLLNKAFVLKGDKVSTQGEFLVYNNYRIENGLIRRTATPRSLRYDKSEWIIFPYYYSDGKLQHYSEKQFTTNFPMGREYLLSFSKELADRKSDSGAEWFEYGRSQALKEINRPKLLVSTIITEKVAVYPLDAEVIPYGGMYITVKTKNPQYNLAFAKSLLESDEFMNYVLDVGIHVNSNSLRITSKDIEDYRF